MRVPSHCRGDRWAAARSPAGKAAWSSTRPGPQLGGRTHCCTDALMLLCNCTMLHARTHAPPTPMHALSLPMAARRRQNGSSPVSLLPPV